MCKTEFTNNVFTFLAESYGPITLEYLNYAAALGVYSVRYPAVFWSCNKALGTIFSLQLVINSAQSLLAYAGMSVLYKVSNAKYSMPVKARGKTSVRLGRPEYATLVDTPRNLIKRQESDKCRKSREIHCEVRSSCARKIDL